MYRIVLIRDDEHLYFNDGKDASVMGFHPDSSAATKFTSKFDYSKAMLGVVLNRNINAKRSEMCIQKQDDKGFWIIDLTAFEIENLTVRMDEMIRL